MKCVLPKRCKLRAMNLLKEINYTVYKLNKKLLDGGYPENIANDTIDYVASFGYVDDLKYAMAYITEKESSYSGSEISLSDLLYLSFEGIKTLVHLPIGLTESP